MQLWFVIELYQDISEEDRFISLGGMKTEALLPICTMDEDEKEVNTKMISFH